MISNHFGGKTYKMYVWKKTYNTKKSDHQNQEKRKLIQQDTSIHTEEQYDI